MQFPPGVRYSEKLSFYNELAPDQNRIRDILVRYLSTTYVVLLERSINSCIYVLNSEPDPDDDDTVVDDTGDDDDCDCIQPNCGHTGVRWGYIDKVRLDSGTYGFDIVTAVTQQALNDALKAKWEANQSLSEYKASFNDIEISVTLEPPKIQLASERGSPYISLYFYVKQGSSTSWVKGEEDPQ